MMQFFETYRGLPKLAPLVRGSSWTHSLLIMGRSKRDEEREGLSKPEDFILALVEVTGEMTTPRYVRRPFQREPDFAATSVNYGLPELLSELRTQMTAEELAMTLAAKFLENGKSQRFTAQVWFQDTWTVRSDSVDAFALPGDSGSLIVSEDGATAVGLLFAVNTRGGYGIFCPIGAVLAAFGNLSLLHSHGT